MAASYMSVQAVESAPLFVCSTQESKRFWMSPGIAFEECSEGYYPRVFNIYNDADLLAFTLTRQESPSFYRDQVLSGAWPELPPPLLQLQVEPDISSLSLYLCVCVSPLLLPSPSKKI